MDAKPTSWWARWFGWGGRGSTPPALATPRATPPTPRVVGPLPTPADLAALPSRTPVAAPWHGVEAPPSSDADVVRTALLQRLYHELDRAPSEGDRTFLNRVVRDCGAARLELPLFPDAAIRLDRLLRAGDPPVSEVAALVRRETDLVRRVWQHASGAAYRGQPPSTLDQAIVRVGFESLWRIGMSACVNGPVFRVRGFQDQANRARACAIVASEVAHTVGAWHPDAYLSGLLHGVGKLVFYRCAVVKPPAPVPDPARVERLAHALHPWVGVLVADAWGFSPGVGAGIAYWPNVEACPEAWRDVARVVRVASIAAETTAEARAGRDCGGLAALAEIEGVDPAKVLSLADAAWAGVAR